MPLGIELGAFLDVRGPSGRLRRRIGVGPDTPLVGVVGRLVPIKAVHVAIDAVRELPDVHLAIVGDGDERTSLERLVREREMDGRVHFTGWFDDVPAAMSDLDVVALSSLNEGTPVALIEALAAQRPVVATRVGCVEHVVVPDRTGLVVPPNDAPALASAIRRLLDDRHLGAQLAAEGRRRVNERFGAARLAADMRALYRELAPRQ
jgi:glycosyltransferase involved in cell wall biosynthesis